VCASTLPGLTRSVKTVGERCAELGALVGEQGQVGGLGKVFQAGLGLPGGAEGVAQGQAVGALLQVAHGVVLQQRAVAGLVDDAAVKPAQLQALAGIERLVIAGADFSAAVVATGAVKAGVVVAGFQPGAQVAAAGQAAHQAGAGGVEVGALSGHLLVLSQFKLAAAADLAGIGQRLAVLQRQPRAVVEGLATQPVVLRQQVGLPTGPLPGWLYIYEAGLQIKGAVGVFGAELLAAHK